MGPRSQGPAIWSYLIPIFKLRSSRTVSIIICDKSKSDLSLPLLRPDYKEAVRKSSGNPVSSTGDGRCQIRTNYNRTARRKRKQLYIYLLLKLIRVTLRKTWFQTLVSVNEDFLSLFCCFCFSQKGIPVIFWILVKIYNTEVPELKLQEYDY